MLKILLCCGGGFSSSALAQKMQKDIQLHKMEDKVMIDFYPFSIAKDKYQEFDIIMCCPHLKMHIPSFVEKEQPQIPIYILPPRMYGLMKIKELYQDALDIIDIFHQHHKNPVFFPNEENILRVTRYVAYHHQ